MEKREYKRGSSVVETSDVLQPSSAHLDVLVKSVSGLLSQDCYLFDTTGMNE